MATNILASRLARLEEHGILVKQPSEQDKRKEEYILTEKGLDLIPVLAEMANWSAEYDPQTDAPPAWIALMKAKREQMIQRMGEMVQSGSTALLFLACMPGRAKSILCVWKNCPGKRRPRSQSAGLLWRPVARGAARLSATRSDTASFCDGASSQRHHHPIARLVLREVGNAKEALLVADLG